MSLKKTIIIIQLVLSSVTNLRAETEKECFEKVSRSILNLIKVLISLF